MSHLIGLDLGTTTVVGLLLDTGRGQVLRVARRRNDAARAGSALPTRAEQDPDRLRTLALQVLAELGKEGAAVHGIWLTGQKHGLLCVDAANRPLTPLISWQDRRTAEPLPGTELNTLDQLHARLDGLDWRDNGCRIAHGYGAAILFWLVQRGELPAATRRVCTIAGWLSAQLVGQPPVTDPTFAASWGIYSLAKAAWNATFLEHLGIDARLLPPVLPSGKALGGLQSGIARQVGLTAGTPVHNAVGDTQASFLGACLPPGALPAEASGISGGIEVEVAPAIFLNIGTGGQICWMVPHFQPPTASVETRPLLPGCYLRVGASLCGGAAYAWLNRTVRGWLSEFGLHLDEDAVYERLNTLAAESEDGHALRVQPTFLGVRGDPTIEAGAIVGITPHNMQLGALARATLVGMVDELRSLYHEHTGPTAHCREVIAAGGAVQRNPLLPDLIEDRFGLPVRVPEHQETAAIGAVGAR